MGSDRGLIQPERLHASVHTHSLILGQILEDGPQVVADLRPTHHLHAPLELLAGQLSLGEDPLQDPDGPLRPLIADSSRAPAPTVRCSRGAPRRTPPPSRAPTLGPRALPDLEEFAGVRPGGVAPGMPREHA